MLRPAFVLVLLAVSVGTSGCTALAALLAAQPATCASAADCAPGYACTEGQCALVETPGSPGAPPFTSVGPEGGTITGPDGTELIVPEGALSQTTGIRIDRVTATLSPVGVAPVSRVYQVRPNLSLDAAATFRLPVEPGACDAECRLFGRPPETVGFSEVAGSGLDGGPVVAGDTTELGLFVAGRPADGGDTTELGLFVAGRPADGGDLDAGPGDAGPGDGGRTDAGQAALDAGPAEGDAGLPDGGAPGAAFAPCSFGPGDCAAGLACVVDPFAAEGAPAGLCLASAEVCDAACACCGPLEAGGPDYCLPASRCGAGGVGDSCADAGVGDCDPLATTACLAAFEEPICTAACTASDEDTVCGGGCCLPTDDGDGGGWCAAVASCALPTGALCLTDDSCASGLCASADGVEPPRCTESCSLDDAAACGPDLCCFPDTCGGGGLCAPSAVCAIDTLVCTATCLDDDACPGGFCDRGECVAADSCGCLDHDDCGPGAYCAIDAPTRSACEAAPDAPCCGTCTAIAPGDCYLDEHCAADAGPEQCQPAADAGCADDPFAQCAGSCAALAPEACASDDECPGARRCIDHTCL